MLQYPVQMKHDTNGTIQVTFPDVPEANTFGDDEADALARAADALETAIMMYIEDRQPIPVPSRIRRKGKLVQLPVLAEAKISLYNAMRAASVKKADLARRLGVHMPQVDRLLDLAHASKLEQIEAALRAVGKELFIEIRDAA